MALAECLRVLGEAFGSSPPFGCLSVLFFPLRRTGSGVWGLASSSGVSAALHASVRPAAAVPGCPAKYPTAAHVADTAAGAAVAILGAYAIAVAADSNAVCMLSAQSSDASAVGLRQMTEEGCADCAIAEEMNRS